MIGCMSGTSLDGIDVCLMKLTGHGLSMTATYEHSVPSDFSPSLQDSLRAYSLEDKPLSSRELCELNYSFSMAHVTAIEKLLTEYAQNCVEMTFNRSSIDLCVIHGQTVFHSPPLSHQMLNGALIAQSIQIPVCYDLRAADLAQGGQGAPITPLADYILFRGDDKASSAVEKQRRERRAVVNLGGFCNVTWLYCKDDIPIYHSNDETVPKGHLVPYTNGDKDEEGLEGREVNHDEGKVNVSDLVSGNDVCAVNQLLDGIARRYFDCNFDYNGQHAARGKKHDDIVEVLTTLLNQQAIMASSNKDNEYGNGDNGDGKRSLGTLESPLGALEKIKADLRDPDLIPVFTSTSASSHRDVNGDILAPPCDIAYSACYSIATTIVNALKQQKVHRAIFAGGGVRNETLMNIIRTLAQRSDGVSESGEDGGEDHSEGIIIESSDVYSLSIFDREAAGMAILGGLCNDRVPITLSSVTGVAKAPVAGVWAYVK